ncbi:hypothetical protein MRB53_033052 [Persea americana]|uniref:Uncharacterized protein n=1 Tax=Persea americana TaxID=3435 RepID=A0ACC2KTK6_PERAE|nr:hypothetical protein MRB53_033052 [Persea americana]
MGRIEELVPNLGWANAKGVGIRGLGVGSDTGWAIGGGLISSVSPIADTAAGSWTTSSGTFAAGSWTATSAAGSWTASFAAVSWTAVVGLEEEWMEELRWQWGRKSWPRISGVLVHGEMAAPDDGSEDCRGADARAGAGLCPISEKISGAKVGDEMGFGIRGPIWSRRIVAEESGEFRSRVDVAVGKGTDVGFGWEALEMGAGSGVGTEIGTRTCRVSGGGRMSGGAGGFGGAGGLGETSMNSVLMEYKT